MRKMQKRVQIGSTRNNREDYPIRDELPMGQKPVKANLEAKKTQKYGPLKYELKQEFKGYKVE